ncbi:MAG: XTP/dITP diphosphatase [Archaeoglobaceae archaeon]|nr:XTP/dITP diphosphatase [Archaeoglobaceae archaeon]MCX8151871.1 XTP/dITP diphosphatase [Archaeoglobaceae archaeon]MDW8014297.1 XTP/dITP diphosphatase [Archaeoglobaceae archaeon]
MIYFVTSNEGKYREVLAIAKKYGLEFEWMKEKYVEIQGKDLEEIARKSAEILSEKMKDKKFFLEDSGLFIEALNGFPGPYSSYVFETIGNEGIIKLMKGVKNRKAYFKAVIAYWDGKEIRTFTGIVEGEISDEIRGSYGFGFDPIFLYSGRTFAEMREEKNEVSHRRRALEKFFEWLNA